MFSRVLLTLAALTVAAVSALVIDCVSPALRLLSADPIGLCTAVEPLDQTTVLWLGTGLALFAFLALIAIWVPTAKRAKRRRVEPDTSLTANLGRLSTQGDEMDRGPRSSMHKIELTRRVEAVETAIEVDSLPTRELTQQWMGLLREANDRHNRGELATEDFKEINTRLLDLFATAADERVPRTG